MRLDKKDVELFYKLSWSLLFYTNQKHSVIQGLNSPDFKGCEMSQVSKLHEKFCSHIEIIDSFTPENPFNFNQKEIDIIKTWKNLIKGKAIKPR